MKTTHFSRLGTAICLATILGINGTVSRADEKADATAPAKTKPREKTHTADFTAKSRPANWSVNFGHWQPEVNVLVCRQLEKDGHAAASRWRIPLQDGTVKAQVKFAGATGFHLGFDPAPGTLKKKGHLYSLVLTPKQVSLRKHKDKNDKQSREEILATGTYTTPEDGWVDITLSTTGDTVDIAIGQTMKIQAKDPTFGVRKPGVVFRVIGGDLYLNNVSVTVAPTLKEASPGK